jgi:hypothetical protein
MVIPNQSTSVEKTLLKEGVNAMISERQWRKIEKTVYLTNTIDKIKLDHMEHSAIQNREK